MLYIYINKKEKFKVKNIKILWIHLYNCILKSLI